MSAPRRLFWRVIHHFAITWGIYMDEAVAAAELTVSQGAVGLYGVSTLEAYRRRGFGTALTLRPLLDARDEGHQLAILQATAIACELRLAG